MLRGMPVSIALALAWLLFLAAACDDEPEAEEPDVYITAEDCMTQGGRVVPNPGGGAPSCDDDEVQIAWVVAIEYGRCCKVFGRP
jgi:hypothetical protein